jgi:hypothetical protein
MKFQSLGGKGAQKRSGPKAPVPQNIVMRLESVITEPNKPGVYAGFDATTKEPIKVRMMTVEEGIVVNVRKGETSEQTAARLKEQYIGNGEKHRPKPSEIKDSAHKAHCEAGGLLMFTKALQNEDGSYRAHWVETLEKSPGAGCDKVAAHIRIEDLFEMKDGKREKTGTQVCADVIRPEDAVFLTKDNLLPVLSSVYANTNGDEKLKPFAFYRLISAEDNKVVLPPARGNALYLKETIHDYDSGTSYDARVAASADQTIINLMSPDAEGTSQDALMIRAALFGLGDEAGYPKFEGIADDLLADLHQVTDYVRSGELRVEVVPGHRISAGPATRASIIKSVQSNAKNPLNTVYTTRNEQGFATERRFADTYLTTKIGKDGHRFFTKGMPVDLFPKGVTIQKLSTKNDLGVAEEAAPEIAQEAVGEADAQGLDSVAVTDVEASLQESQQALESTM